MKKNGFTLVELTIVILVIGILLFLVSKSLGLVGTAKLRKEVGRLAKLEEGFHAHLAHSGGVMPYSDIGVMLTDELVFNGFIQKTDLESVLMKGNQWQYQNINYPEGDIGYYTKTSVGNAIGLAMKDDMNLELVCYIETNLDDRRMNIGSGRLYSGSATDNCSSLGYPGFMAGIQYVYRIYK